MDSSQELKPLRDAVQSALVTVTRSVNSLANEDLQFHRTVHPSVATRLDQSTERLLRLASGVLKSAGKLTAQKEPRLDDVDDVEIQWKSIVDVIDTLLEKSDTCLDEYTGLIKRKDVPAAENVSPPRFPILRSFLTVSQGRELKRSKPTTERLDWSLKRANILKPQNAFERKTDNLESGPWKPVLTTKPHAQIPLDASLPTFTNDEGLTQYAYSPQLWECFSWLTFADTNTRTSMKLRTCSTPAKSSSRANPSSTSQSKRRRRFGSTRTRVSWRCWRS